MCSGLSDHVPDCIALVAVEIIHDDDVARSQGGHENLFDIGLKAQAVDRAIKNTGCSQTVGTKGRNEGERLPVAMRQFGGKALTLPAPAPEPGHVGLDPGLIDADEARDVDARQILLPPVPSARDVRPQLLCWQNAFF